MISDIICDKLTQNPPIIPLNPPVSGANAANNFWKVRRKIGGYGGWELRNF